MMSPTASELLLMATIFHSKRRGSQGKPAQIGTDAYVPLGHDVQVAIVHSKRGSSRGQRVQSCRGAVAFLMSAAIRDLHKENIAATAATLDV